MNIKVEILKKLLADSYALYLQSQNYHWNVTGPYFASLHTLFETHYTELAEAVDEVAERIRALDVRAPGSFGEFSALTKVDAQPDASSSEAMIKALIASHEVVIRQAQQVLEAAQDANDDVTADLATGRLTVHEKAKWMLQSSL